jgi:hypothetical protein
LETAQAAYPCFNYSYACAHGLESYTHDDRYHSEYNSRIKDWYAELEKVFRPAAKFVDKSQRKKQVLPAAFMETFEAAKACLREKFEGGGKSGV